MIILVNEQFLVIPSQPSLLFLGEGWGEQWEGQYQGGLELLGEYCDLFFIYIYFLSLFIFLFKAEIYFFCFFKYLFLNLNDFIIFCIQFARIIYSSLFQIISFQLFIFFFLIYINLPEPSLFSLQFDGCEYFQIKRI